MDSFLGIILVITLFVLLAGVIYVLIRKNTFSSASKKYINRELKRLRLNELKKENEELNNEIKFLEEKNKRLRYKIEQMKKVINSLEEQKRQLEKSEKRLLKLREKKDETLAMVAHDLKNPASTIKNFVELLESYDLSAQEQQDVLTGLIETSSRLVRLADEFSHVLTEEYVQLDLKKEKSNIKEIVESIVKVNRVKASKKNIEIRLYQPEEIIETEVDADKIKEVVDNFVGNAVKFCPEKSKIEIVTQLEKNSLTIEVKDNGFGLTEDEIKHAFEKGTKLSNKPTGDETSSGLGLWIAKKIVEEHNGRVWVKSKKGLGATFSFTIPIK